MSEAFPCVIDGHGDLADHVAGGKASVDQALARSGAILFRGFHVPTAQAFDAAIRAFDEPNFAYASSMSNAVRLDVTELVFTANEAPPTTEIFLHHEMAQTPTFPGKLFFYCEIAADEGGATPLCRSDKLLHALEDRNPAFVAALEAHGVRYSNVMPAADDAGSGQGRSWRSTLRVQSRSEAECRLQELGYEWSWGEEDVLLATTPALPAVRTLSDGRKVFFNQLIAAYRGWAGNREASYKPVRLGDGAELPEAGMADAIALAEELTVDLDWRPGDVALLDNHVVMHGRRPFEGRRRVLASLIK